MTKSRVDMPVEQADAEFRRMDSEIAGVKKSQEKFETKTALWSRFILANEWQ
jgi:hypothetical protein